VIGTAVIIAEHGLELSPVGLLLSYGSGAIWVFGFQFVLSRLYFVEVSRDGISGSTFWGRRGFLRWDQIRSTRLYYMFPLGLMHVRTFDHSPALWLPTHVRGQSDLAKDLRNFAPTGNPLVGPFAKFLT
jgi:hypothetical protein